MLLGIPLYFRICQTVRYESQGPRQEREVKPHHAYLVLQSDNSDAIVLSERITAHQGARSEWYTPRLCWMRTQGSKREIGNTYKAEATSCWDYERHKVSSAR
jgi:hypothetical protein